MKEAEELKEEIDCLSDVLIGNGDKPGIAEEVRSIRKDMKLYTRVFGALLAIEVIGLNDFVKLMLGL